VNAFGEDVLGWDRPIPFLSQRSSDITIFGWSLGVPTALISVIIFQAWRYFPFAFLFILARLQAVPADLDEAGRVDGATPLQRFRYILLPQLSGVIALLAVLRFIWTFNEFDDIYLLTGGGAGTEVISIGVFNRLTARGDIGASAALALVLAALLAIFLLLYFRFFASKAETSL
jgi:multiple sugar transport system permease protein